MSVDMIGDIEWRVSNGITPYLEAVSFMEQRALEIYDGTSPQLIWLVEHPPLYTAGTSANIDDLHDPDRFPVYQTKRGGQYTYHGPGQRVVYVMLDLTKQGKNVRDFVSKLESWVLATLETFNVTGSVHPDRIGVWVNRTRPGAPSHEDKIAAIGIKLRRWVSYHGLALNVEPDLSHFDSIVPCGISTQNLGVTSLVDLGLPVTMDDVDHALKETFTELFSQS